MAITDQVVDDAPARVPSRQGRRVVLGALGAAVALLLAALGWTWLVDPDAVTPVGDAVSSTGPVGVSVFGTNISTHGPRDQQFDPGALTVDLVSVAPRVVENTADAVVTLALCLPAGSEGIGTGVPAQLAALCQGAGAVPVPTGSIALGSPPDAQIVALVTTRRPGVVRIAGYDVVYRDGVRRGSVLAGIVTTVNATAS